MKKVYIIKSCCLLLFAFLLANVLHGQGIPELMYYKFDAAGTTTSNQAQTPVGTNPSNLVSISIGGTGQFGTALQNTGVANQYVDNGWATNLVNTDWTISFWVNNLPSSTTLWYLFGDAGNSMRCFVNGAPGQGNMRLTGTGLPACNVTGVTGAPHVLHFVREQSPNQITVYKDGVFHAVYPITGTPTVGTGFRIGSYSGNSGLNGELDEFRLYNRALSAAEIAATWNISLTTGSICNQPSALTVSNISSGSADFSWGAVTGATGYEYEVNTSPTPPTGAGTPTTSTSFTDGTLSPNTAYYVHVRSDCGAGGFSGWNTVSFTTCPDAQITSTNPNFAVCTGDELVLNADTGAGFTYQWYYNGTPIGGAGLPFFNTGFAGSYEVEINSGNCIMLSPPVVVTLIPLPAAIISPAQPDPFCAGTSSALSANTGTGLTYQWLFNNTPVIGATSGTYNATAGGVYHVQVDDGTCTAISDSVVLTELPAPVPVITSQYGADLSTGTFVSYQWAFNGTAISGAIAQNYMATQNGIYTVTVVDVNGCEGTSGNFTVSNVSVDETENLPLLIYPNPTRGIFFIRSSIDVSVRVLSMDGKLVHEAPVTREVDMSHLQQGLYLIILNDASGHEVKREKVSLLR